MRKNLTDEGSWGNLLEQLKLAHPNPPMSEEIGKAQKMSLGLDFDFYEQLCLQFILDEVNTVKSSDSCKITINCNASRLSDHRF